MTENETIRYYDDHAVSYAESTAGAQMKYARERFLFYIQPEGKILDLGCGSGRDTVFFLEKGYQVTAADGSEQMCREAEKRTGIPVRHMRFDELSEKNVYNGIWACASLLHTPYAELEDIMKRIMDALVPEGTVYASFKYGTKEEMRDGRYYTDLDVERLYRILSRVPGCLLLECWKSHDVRKEMNSQMWLNFIARKTDPAALAPAGIIG